MNVQLGPMDDPAERWDSPLNNPTTRGSSFYDSLTAADENIAELAALRAQLAVTKLSGNDHVPQWKPLAAGIASLVERYQSDAADCTQREAITNLASLLRHASAFAGALSREVERYSVEVVDARIENNRLKLQLRDAGCTCDDSDTAWMDCKAHPQQCRVGKR